MYLQNLFFDLINNFFDFFIMELFTLTFFSYSHIRQKTTYRYLFCVINLIISVVPQIPYIEVICFGLNLLYFCLISSFHIKDSIIFCIKYSIFIKLLYFFTIIICALINLKTLITIDQLSDTFSHYQVLTSTILAYILLNLYVNTKRLRTLHIKTLYPVIFSILSTGIVLLMLFFSGTLSFYPELTGILPWIYIFIIGVLALSLNSYRNIIEVLEEQLNQKLLVEKYEMELTYFNNVQDSLDTLSRIRHDFKNHMIVLDTYASQGRTMELREYIAKISSKLSDTKLISTPNNLISSILNTKNAVCQHKGITFLTHCEFTELHISDFVIVTVLGNLLDNAITAASQTPDGTVELSLLQSSGYLQIICQNNHAGDIIEKNGVFTSTKKEADGLHGLGIKIIRDCVAAQHGTTDITYDTQSFSVEILLPNHA